VNFIENKGFSGKKMLFAALAVSLFVTLSLSSFAYAVAPYPSVGTATVDGQTSEWNLATDFFADMTRAGQVNDNHPLESKAYLRYDADTETMYVLVLTESGVSAVVSNGDAWAAINTISNKVFTGASTPNFAWVGQGYDSNSAHALGYEASFHLAIGEYLIILHLQVLDTGSYETSATAGLKAGIDLFAAPETAFGTTIISIFAAVAVFAGIRHYRSRTK